LEGKKAPLQSNWNLLPVKSVWQPLTPCSFNTDF